MKDLYAILGVPQTADRRTIDRAFRSLSKKLHPDMVGDGGTRHFQDIVEAYSTLSHPARRAAYDRTLRAARARTRPRPRAPQGPGWFPAGNPPDPPAGPHPWNRRPAPEPLIPRRPAARTGDYARRNLALHRLFHLPWWWRFDL